ncbi:hypothetical protein [Chryseobacterium sp. MDT2-18]|uniref:hypothetical protein n=1 Tax=Chryseobacterium sp. MDT2-18 TaxID=1259136 RepID=UPI002787ABF4|nr:hypothetical protein [Chryseobacterium sp. MDT2-18]MDQ0477457.1 hypothetical protein [Chryseobacterium sp. MDT2-18]
MKNGILLYMRRDELQVILGFENILWGELMETDQAISTLKALMTTVNFSSVADKVYY